MRKAMHKKLGWIRIKFTLMFTESQYINVTYHIPDQFRIPLTSSGRSCTAWKSPSLRKPVSTIMTHVTQGTVPAWSLAMNSESGAGYSRVPSEYHLHVMDLQTWPLCKGLASYD